MNMTDLPILWARPDQDIRDPEPSTPGEIDGFIDLYGYLAGARAWIFCGWIRDGAADLDGLICQACFEDAELHGPINLVRHARSDLDRGAVGFVMLVEGTSRRVGRLHNVQIGDQDRAWHLPVAASAERAETELQTCALRLLDHAAHDHRRDSMRRLIARRGFAGIDTLHTLTDFVRIGIDHTIRVAPNGLFLVGWLIAPPHCMKALRLCCGAESFPINDGNSIRVDRDDVVHAFEDCSHADRRCGFMAMLPKSVVAGETIYLEVETTRGEIAHALLPMPQRRGMDAIRFVAGLHAAEHQQVAPLFDRVLGPAISGLNRERLAFPPRYHVSTFGIQDHEPKYSIIVPLYGRLDYLEMQLALFARSDWTDYDILYVLDDPDATRECHQLAQSAYERFGVKFRLVTLEQNLGYAPANNVGLGLARGDIICFLNSDVFPIEKDWLPRLAMRLQGDPGLGAIGPLLLFEDGSIQHEGIALEPLPECAGWRFPHHIRKGRKPDRIGLHPHLAITGACLVMRTAIARRLGGFDISYVLGDFEDTDLCLRLRQIGLSCAVDHNVRLYHLERRSQASPDQLWRANLTRFNAWQHQKRWFTT